MIRTRAFSGQSSLQTEITASTVVSPCVPAIRAALTEPDGSVYEGAPRWGLPRPSLSDGRLVAALVVRPPLNGCIVDARLADAVEERSTDLVVRQLLPSEATLASDVVMQAYRTATTTRDSPEGVEEFTRYASPAGISARMSAGSIVMVACLGAIAVGVVEIRSPGHIGLLFISPEYQGRGIGRTLCEAALVAFAKTHTPPPKLTVKSSPGAVAFYEKVGFLVTGEVTELNGIRFVPMERDLGA